MNGQELPRSLIGFLLLIAAGIILNGPVGADTLGTFNGKRTAERQASRERIDNLPLGAPVHPILDDEYARIYQGLTSFRNLYLTMQEEASIPFVGQPVVAGSFAPRFDPGESVQITFAFIDPGTQLTVAGPAIGFVLYEVNLDPFTPDIYLPLGTATDAATNFSFPFLVSGFEPDIRATPFSLTGIPIFVAGVGDFNVAVGFSAIIPTGIPEPSSALLLITGGLAMIFVRRGMRARRSSHEE